MKRKKKRSSAKIFTSLKLFTRVSCSVGVGVARAGGAHGVLGDGGGLHRDPSHFSKALNPPALVKGILGQEVVREHRARLCHLLTV